METLSNEKIIAALTKVPEKRLKLIELAIRVPIKNGAPDPQYLQGIQVEVSLSMAEAKAYGAHTIQAVDALTRLKGEGEA